MTLPEFFESDRAAIEAALERFLPPVDIQPSSIHEAMRYSVFAGGKRLRPIMCIESARMFSDPPDAAIPVACAFEMIHTYSLIHDDLPAMDDDDCRRGKPSCHKKFGEAIAILAGDALLTFAFETLSGCDTFPPDRMLKVLSMLAHASGAEWGMIAGQVFDLEAEGAPIDQVDVE